MSTSAPTICDQPQQGAVERKRLEGMAVMPTYEYRAKDSAKACGHCRDRFEVRQTMSEEPLRTCPACKNPVERIISLCTITTTPSVRSRLSDKNLKEKGFAKLVNEGGGKFRKVT